MTTTPQEPQGNPDVTPTGEPTDPDVDPLSPGSEPPGPADPEPEEVEKDMRPL